MAEEKLETILQLAGKANWEREEDSRVAKRDYQDGGWIVIRGKNMGSIHLDYINYQITYHGSIKGKKDNVDIYITKVDGSKKDGWGCYESGSGIDHDTWYGLFAYLNGVNGIKLGEYTGNKIASYYQINPKVKELYESIETAYQKKQEEKEKKREEKEKQQQESALEKAKDLIK